MKADHFFEKDRAHKSPLCARPGCGLRSGQHPSRLERDFDDAVHAAGLDFGMVAEFEFAEAVGRGWRFDRAWPALMLAVELDGGTFMAQGRHSTQSDRARMNYAQLAGWLTLTFTDRDVRLGLAVRQLTAAIMIRARGEGERAALTSEMFPLPAAIRAATKRRRAGGV